MPTTIIDRTHYNSLLDFDGTPGSGSVWDKADVDAMLDAIDAILAGGIEFGGVLTGPAQPRCVAYNNAAQSIATATYTALLLNSEDVDVGTMHSTTTNTSRITIPAGAGGLYLARGVAAFAANATGQRQVGIAKSGGLQTIVGDPVASAAGLRVMAVTWIGALVPGEYLELLAYQESGGNLDVGTGTRYATNELAVVKLW